MEIGPHYKRTEAGVIPHDWDVKRLKDFASVRGGKRLPLGRTLTAKPTSHPYIRVSDMRPGGVALGDIRYVPDDVFPVIKNYRIFSDDLFISVAGTLGLVGKISPRLDGANLTENADRITCIKCDQDFLLYYLSTHRIQSSIDSVRTVGAQPKLALNQIENFKIALPPTKTEQRAIADSLRDVDACLSGLNRLIVKKRDLKQAAMQQLLSGKTRLTGFHGEWQLLKMADDSTLKARIGWQGLTTTEYLTSGSYYLLTGTDFAQGKVTWATCCFVSEQRYAQDRNIQVRSKDILLTKDGTIGKVGFVDDLPGPATLNSGVFVIRPKNESYDPKFFFYVLTSRIFDDFLTKLQAGSTISHLYQKDFVNFSFKAPPTVKEQTAIAEVLTDMDAELAASEQRFDKTRDLKQAMMQQLLTGETRLI
jgi:type I restriction enzyme, S subunit